MTGMTRRAALGAGLATAVAAATAGCRTDDVEDPDIGDETTESAKDVRPVYVAYDGPKADLPGDATTGVPDAYFSYPDPPPSTGRIPLGVSDPVSFMTSGANSWYPELAKNGRWQQLNADVGTEVSATVIATDYLAKFQTSVAADSISDFTLIVPAPDLPELLESRFTDLTPYLAGDNVKKYPNLAGFLTGSAPATWRERLHLEHARNFHALTDGRAKYVWVTDDGREHFFDLVNDPQERHDLTRDPTRADEIARWRQHLVEALRDRPEGFMVGNELQPGREYGGMIPYPPA